MCSSKAKLFTFGVRFRSINIEYSDNFKLVFMQSSAWFEKSLKPDPTRQFSKCNSTKSASIR